MARYTSLSDFYWEYLSGEDLVDEIMACTDNPVAMPKRTISGVLREKKHRLESELAETTAALDALESNPEIAKVFDLVAKAINLR